MEDGTIGTCLVRADLAAEDVAEAMWTCGKRDDWQAVASPHHAPSQQDYYSTLPPRAAPNGARSAGPYFPEDLKEWMSTRGSIPNQKSLVPVIKAYHAAYKQFHELFYAPETDVIVTTWCLWYASTKDCGNVFQGVDVYHDESVSQYLSRIAARHDKNVMEAKEEPTRDNHQPVTNGDVPKRKKRLSSMFENGGNKMNEVWSASCATLSLSKSSGRSRMLPRMKSRRSLSNAKEAAPTTPSSSQQDHLSTEECETAPPPPPKTAFQSLRIVPRRSTASNRAATLNTPTPRRSAPLSDLFKAPQDHLPVAPDRPACVKEFIKATLDVRILARLNGAHVQIADKIELDKFNARLMDGPDFTDPSLELARATLEVEEMLGIQPVYSPSYHHPMYTPPSHRPMNAPPSNIHAPPSHHWMNAPPYHSMEAPPSNIPPMDTPPFHQGEWLWDESILRESFVGTLPLNIRKNRPS